MKDGWHIEHDPKPIPDRSHDYNVWHDDYDGTNHLSLTAGFIEEALQLVEELTNE